MKRIMYSSVVLIALISLGCTNRKMLLKAPVVDIDPELVTEISPVQIPAEAEEGEEVVAVNSDPLLNRQWDMQKISAPKVWEKYSGSRAVTVMLIGTGINYNHPDLRQNIALNRGEYDVKDSTTGKPNNKVDDDGNGWVDDFVGYDYVDEDGLAYDHFGYDTYAAGIIGAVHNNGVGIKGIAQQVSIYPVRYINANGMSSLPLLVSALKHILKTNPHLVLLNLLNLDMGRDKNERGVGEVELELVGQVMKEIYKKGIPVIVGAGNVSLEVTSEMKLLRALADYDNVFIVSSSDHADKKAFLANFSSKVVQTFAPGEGVLSTAPDGSWEVSNGTQLAAAHVAGALALAISVHGKSKTYAQYFDVLRSTAGSEEVSAFSTMSVGRNRLNVERFLTALQ